MEGGEQMKKLTTILTSLILFVMCFAFAMSANAQLTEKTFWGEPDIQEKTRTSLGLPTSDIRVTIANIINVALGLLGIVAVVIVLLGGFRWMIAGGDETKVDEAKNLIKAGIIGLAIIVSAYAIANFVIKTLIGASK